MSLRATRQRLSALVLNEIYLTRHRMEMAVDTFFFPMINVILFGFITSYIGTGKGVNGLYFVIGVLLWEVLLVMQYNTSVSTMWSIWSHNLSNIFIAPISTGEYLLAQGVAAAVRTLTIVTLLSIGTAIVFDFNILQLGVLNVLFFTINLLLFAASLGFALLGVVFRFGTRLQAVTWGAIYLFQPLVGAFFPVSVLPGFLQPISYMLPPTYVFEAARAALKSTAVNWEYALFAFGLNMAFMVLCVIIFRALFRKSRETGQFARNDL